MSPATIRLFGTAADSIVDGPGLRFTVFVQGCPRACPGCHNPESQPMDGGYVAKIDTLVQEITSNKLIQGITLSGGEPLAQSAACLELVKRVRGLGHSLWLYTGYLFEEIIDGKRGQDAKALVALCDVVVDGEFIEGLKSYQLTLKGSSNQRVIDVSKSLETNQIILWENPNDLQISPPSPW